MSRRKSLKSALRKEDGVTSRETNRIAEELLNAESEINLDFLNSGSVQLNNPVKEESIVLKRSQFLYLGPRSSRIIESMKFPSVQTHEEVHTDLRACIENNLLGKWSIVNQQPFTSEMLDNLVCLCLLDDKDIATSASEYFLAVFEQMITASSQVRALYC